MKVCTAHPFVPIWTPLVCCARFHFYGENHHLPPFRLMLVHCTFITVNSILYLDTLANSLLAKLCMMCSGGALHSGTTVLVLQLTTCHLWTLSIYYIHTVSSTLQIVPVWCSLPQIVTLRTFKIRVIVRLAPSSWLPLPARPEGRRGHTLPSASAPPPHCSVMWQWVQWEVEWTALSSSTPYRDDCCTPYCLCQYALALHVKPCTYVHSVQTHSVIYCFALV